jgi:hypothetical protein
MPIFDITSRKKSEEQALYQARHDALTGLANYREFMDRLEAEVRRAERSHRSFTCCSSTSTTSSASTTSRATAGNRALKRLAAVMNEHCRSNTYKSVSKQRTLSTFRINTDKKPGGGGGQSFPISFRIFIFQSQIPAPPGRSNLQTF